MLFVWKDVGCRAYLVLGRNNIVFIRLACAVCMEGRLVVTALLGAEVYELYAFPDLEKGWIFELL